MKTQLLLDQRDVAQAIKEYIQNKMSPGVDLDVTVFVHGEHPKKAQSSEAVEMRQGIWKQALARSTGLSVSGSKVEPNPEDMLLATWGALVIVNGLDSNQPATSSNIPTAPTNPQPPAI